MSVVQHQEHRKQPLAATLHPQPLGSVSKKLLYLSCCLSVFILLFPSLHSLSVSVSYSLSFCPLVYHSLPLSLSFCPYDFIHLSLTLYHSVFQSLSFVSLSLSFCPTVILLSFILYPSVQFPLFCLCPISPSILVLVFILFLSHYIFSSLFSWLFVHFLFLSLLSLCLSLSP